MADAREALMGQLAAVAEEAGQLQSDLQHKAGVIAAQVRRPNRFLLSLGLSMYLPGGVLRQSANSLPS